MRLQQKVQLLLQLIEDIYKSPRTGDGNKELIEERLKKIHGTKKSTK